MESQMPSLISVERHPAAVRTEHFDMGRTGRSGTSRLGTSLKGGKRAFMHLISVPGNPLNALASIRDAKIFLLPLKVQRVKVFCKV
jgi:hypothetical protein